MHKKIDISVIIPMYNSQKFIKDAIESIFMQVGMFFIEIIVIDDFSSDNSVNEVEKTFNFFGKKYKANNITPRLIKNNSNMGVAKTRNIGIDIAKGEYIAFLDADDIFSPYKLKKQIDYMNKTNAYLCCTGRNIINHYGVSDNNYIKVTELIKYKDLLKTNRICCSSVLIKSEIIKKYHFEHDEYHEDYYLWLRIVKDNGPANGLNEPLIQSRMTVGGKSRNKFKSSIMHYNVYKLMGLNPIVSIYYFILYIIYGLEKYYFKKNIISYYNRNLFKMVTQYFILPFFYNINRWRKVDNNLVVFVDAHHSDTPINMKPVKNKIVNTNNFEVLELYKDFSSSSSIKNLLFSISFMKHYAKAKYVFICDNFLPIASCRKKKNTKVIQLWHACGSLKKFGYDSFDDIPSFYKGNVYNNYDFVTVSSDYCVDPFSTAMKQKNNSVQPFGISKTDYYFNKNFKEETKTKFYKEHKEAVGKKIVLWAPTFRGKAIDPYIEGIESIKILEKKLEKHNYYLISKLHPHHNKKHSLRTSELYTEELVTLADFLITDYSSVLFDFLLIKENLILFNPDIHEYQKNRGFYFNYDEIPGVQLQKMHDIYEYLISYDKESIEKSKIISFRKKFLNNCFGNSTNNILENVGIEIGVSK